MAGGGVGGANLQITVAAKDESSHIVHGIGESLEHFKESIADVAKTAAGFAIGGLIQSIGGGLEGAISGSIEKMTELGSETNKLSRETGMSAESTSTLLSVFEKFGVGVGQASASLGIFSKHLSGAGDTLDEMGNAIAETAGKSTPFTDAMDKINVKILDANGKARDMATVMKEARDAIQALPDSLETTALATDIFGKAVNTDGLILGQTTHKFTPFTDALNQLGVRLIDANGKTRDMATVMAEAHKALALMPKTMETTALQTTIFGTNLKSTTTFISEFTKGVTALNTETDNSATFLANFGKGVTALDTAAKGPKGFSKVMAELGIDFKDATGKVLPMAQILGEVADKFKAMPDGVAKTADAMALFGKSGKDMIPVLNLGKEGMTEMQDEAKKLGLSLSGENLAQIKAYGMAQKEMGEAVGGLQLQLGLVLLPALVAVATAVAKAAITFNVELRPAIAALYLQLAALAQQFVGTIQAIESNKLAMGVLTVVAVPLALALGAAGVSAAVTAVSLAATAVATDILAVSQAALNVVMDANPIGVVVLALAALAAGYVYAYQNSEVFRDVVDSVFASVKSAVLTVVDVFDRLLTLINQVVNAFRTVGDAASHSPLAGVGASLSSLGSGSNLPGMGGFAAQVTVNQTFHGAADPVAVGQASHNGVLAGARAMGLS